QLEGVRTEIKSLESVESSVSDPVASPAQAPEEEGKCGTPENGEEDWEGDYEAKIAAHKAVGNKNFQEGDYPAAIKAYGSAILILKKKDLTLEKQYAPIFANQSAAHLATKKWVAASWNAQCAAKADPGFWKGHWRHGVSLMAMAPRIERSKNAVEAFERCMEVCPEEKKEEVSMALERAKVRLQEGKDRTPMPPQCQQS
ncbi:hypothetical protein TrRE_jg3205, partial [Triparma retinervis]